MTLTLGILLFPLVEELDFCGPFEVLRYTELKTPSPLRVLTISEHSTELTCAKGLKVRADTTISLAPPLDILILPGGDGTRTECKNEAFLEWIRAQAERCRFVISVCTGARLLLASGVGKDKRITTYFEAVEELREWKIAKEVVEGVRYVRDGKVVSAAGVSAGIDVSLWLVGELFGRERAREVQKGIEYYPEPPYQE